jgi:ribosome-binding protein aMBF1 (putative translation factor)
MAFNSGNCFSCGDTGHIAAECPNSEALDTRPAWCGICDRRTRLVTINIDTGAVKRCPECHPNRRKHVAQLHRCNACKCLVYEWDNARCGHHEMPGVTDKRPGREHIEEIVGSNYS